MPARVLVLAAVVALLVAPLTTTGTTAFPAPPLRHATTAAAQIADDGRLNILLLGGDAAPDRGGLRTDSMIVVSIDLAVARVAMFGVPRDMVNIPLPAEVAHLFPCRCWPDLINALYGYGVATPDLFPTGNNPGATALMDTLGELLGIYIDHYALVDMLGFVEVVDALGGLTIDVPAPVVIQPSPPEEGGEWHTYDIQPGRQQLDGHAALAYARYRGDGNDYNRMGRQRCVLGALARGADVPTLLRQYSRLVEALRESVETDLPLELLPDLIKLVDRVDTNQVVAIGFVPPIYAPGARAGDGRPIPDVDRIRLAVQDAFRDSAAIGEQSLETLSVGCGWGE